MTTVGIREMVNYFEVLELTMELTIEEIQVLDEDTIKRSVEGKYEELRQKSMVKGGLPAPGGRTQKQWREEVLKPARDTLINPEKRSEHIKTIIRYKPTVSFTIPRGTQIGSTFTFRINFSKSVIGFTLDDIKSSSTYTGTGNLSLKLRGSGKSYTVTVTVPAGLKGNVKYKVKQNAVSDGTWSGPASEQTSPAINFDTTVPMVSFKEPKSTQVGNTFNVPITFSKSVTEFDASDITVTTTPTGGSRDASVTLSGSGKDYTATITSPMAAKGTVTLEIAAHEVTDGTRRGPASKATSSAIAFDTTGGSKPPVFPNWRYPATAVVGIFTVIALYNFGFFSSVNEQNRQVDRVTHYVQIGDKSWENGEYGQAITNYEKAISIESNNSVLHNKLGIAYYKNEAYNAAIVAFKQAISINSEFKKAHYNLGLSYFKVKRFHDAKRAIEAALKIDPNYQSARRLLDTIEKELEPLPIPPPPPLPPKLSIVHPVLIEPSGEGFLDAGEKAHIKFTVKNDGGTARDITVQLKWDSIIGLSYKSQAILTLHENNSKAIEIPIIASRTVKGKKDLKVEIQLRQKNGQMLGYRIFYFTIRPLLLKPIR